MAHEKAYGHDLRQELDRMKRQGPVYKKNWFRKDKIFFAERTNEAAGHWNMKKLCPGKAKFFR